MKVAQLQVDTNAISDLKKTGISDSTNWSLVNMMVGTFLYPAQFAICTVLHILNETPCI